MPGKGLGFILGGLILRMRRSMEGSSSSTEYQRRKALMAR